MIKLPQGKSDFGAVSLDGYHYVDKTGYLRNLESLGNSYQFFLRPRRFGKSLFVSMMMHYYGEQHKEQFGQLFGKYDIGRNPTPLANKYLTLFFTFTGIETSSEEGTYAGFLNNIQIGIKDFFIAYPAYFKTEKDWKPLAKIERPAVLIDQFFLLVRSRVPQKSIYLFIDEYDHFANELLAFNFQHFQHAVSENGYVRKFYEKLKDATLVGTVERIFITGVTPITVDSMTSGFNIGTNISLNPTFHGMAGFFEEDVREIMTGVGVTDERMPAILADMKAWYDGYLFEEEQTKPVFNSNMALFFAEQWRQFQQYPKKMLDVNVASDYKKVGNLFKLMNPALNVQALRDLIERGYTESMLTEQYSFQRPWTKADFVTMLYCLGFLTHSTVQHYTPRFVVPNYVIKELYYDYFLEVVVHRAQLDFGSIDARHIGTELAYEHNPVPLTGLISDILRGIADRDKVGFDEKYVKSIAQAALHMSGVFFIKSEYPVQGGYVDLLLLQRPQNPDHAQIALELKWLPKKDAKKLAATVGAATEQLKRYRSDPQLASVERLRTWLFVFVGNEVKRMEEI